MDFVKKAAESVKGNSGSGQNPPAEGGQKQDYVDKGTLFLVPLSWESKSGLFVQGQLAD